MIWFLLLNSQEDEGLPPGKRQNWRRLKQQNGTCQVKLFFLIGGIIYLFSSIDYHTLTKQIYESMLS
jgi:hypothetical protein